MALGRAFYAQYSFINVRSHNVFVDLMQGRLSGMPCSKRGRLYCGRIITVIGSFK